MNILIKIFEALWVSGLNLNDQAIIDKVLKNLDINPKTFALRLSNQNIKDELKKRTKKLLKKEFLVLLLFMLIIKYFGGKIDLNLL